MRFKEVINRIVGLTGYTIHKIAPEYMVAYKGVYNQDGLRSIHNHKFMLDPDFCKAYNRGILACEADYHWHWRVHIGLWAAFSASKLKGDFVECGVNYGFLSSAIMEYLDWDSLDKTFYLMDTFSGIDERYVSDDRHRCGILNLNKSGFYTTSFEPVKKNFSQWKNIKIIIGSIPETLNAVESDSIAYLHIDMNNPLPEVAAFNFFWERLVPGAFILLDDYAYIGCEAEKDAMDAAVAAKDLKIVSLPTGQGILIKPF
jgi:hypothetical protein